MSRILHHIGRNDLKKTRQRQIGEQKERAAQKLKESQEAEAKRKQIKEAARPYKSNWREETQLQESDWLPLSGSIANSTSQTFQYSTPNFQTGEPNTVTVSGLGGVEAIPSEVNVDFGFGEKGLVPAPEYGQYGMQGYAAKLNPKYTEAQKKYQKELAEWEKKRDENFQKVKDTLKSFGTSFEELRASKKWVKKLGDGTFVALMPTSSNADIMNWTDNVRVVKLKQAANADPMYIDYNTKQIDPVTGKERPWMAYNVETQNDVYLGVGERPKPPMEQEYLMPRRTDFKDVNPQLDASQEFAQNVDSDYMMNARVTDTSDAPIYDPYFQRIYDPAKTPFGSDYGEVSQVIDGEKLLPQRVQDILKKGRNKPARGGPDAINRELLDNYFKPEIQDVLQHRPELHDRYLRQMTGGAGGGYVPGGGMIDPSALANAAAAAGSNVSDFIRGLPQPGDDGYVNPNVFGRLARSITDPIRYSGNTMFQGNPAGRAPGLSNFWSPNPAAAGTYSNPGNAKGIPGTRPNPTGTLTTAPRPRNVPRVTRGLTGTPQFKFPKGQVPPSNMFTQTADDAAVKAAQNVAQKSGGKTLSKFLSRVIPFANAALAGADAGNRVRQGDYVGAALGAATAIPGPAGWAALGGQMMYDAGGRPFMGAPATTPTSGRGAGRSSFSTSDGNVVPRSNSANANSVGQRGSDGGMTDAQIKAAQDKANAARRSGKMSDIRGSQANKGFAPDPKTGEPRYTGMNDQQFSDAYNKITDKYNNLRGPLEKQLRDFAGRQAPASLGNKINALNDAQTAEEQELFDKRDAQEKAFNDAQNDWMAQETAASEARAKAVDEIDNEKDPFSDLLSKLGYERDKLQRQGKAIKRWEIVGPGEEGYVDTTNMANAIGYNRRPIYTAAANELDKQIDAAQKSQMAWMNARDKRRQAAIDADYKPKRGQGGLPLGTTTNRSGGAMGSGSQASSLASQAASAGMNPQQRRKRGMKESTWDRINKYR